MASILMRPSGGRATLEQVAAAASVSRATASRVVNGDRRVGGSARAAVESAIQQLRYVPNRAARSLVTRRTDSVAVVIPEPTARLFGDPFFPRVLRGISEALDANEMQLVLLMPQARSDEERVERYLAAGHGDGVLLISLHGSDPLPERLRRHGIPLVVGGRPPSAGSPYVDVDNRGGAALAVQHLLDAGRRQVGTIAGPQDMAPGTDRLAGFHDRLSAAGRPAGDAAVEIADFTLEGGRAAMERLLARVPAIDAVFVASDLMAVGALAALRAAGRSIPGDVAVVGFDDSPLASTTQPFLSSVRQPIEEMGREMTRLLMQEIRAPGGAPRRVILETQLVVRESSAGVGEGGATGT
ncbi:MAG TPA: LacI family DNA-binding transcriptional regulator [Candidatus Limnocylindrales bacterium]|nr:LacI family DNA-binding transcriptional regulator [Candidatus Limnocylindrales bacterium]